MTETKIFKVLITTECSVKMPIGSSDSKVIVAAFTKLNLTTDIDGGITLQPNNLTAKVLK